MSDNIGLYAARFETIEQAAPIVFGAIAGRLCCDRVLDLVFILLKKFPDLIYCRDEQGRSLAKAAVLEGNVDVLCLLIRVDPSIVFCPSVLDLGLTANRPLISGQFVVGEVAAAAHHDEGTSSEVQLYKWSAERPTKTRTKQQMQWSLLLMVMVFIASVTYALPLSFRNIYPLSSTKPVKTVNLSIRELLTFPTATSEGFFLLTTDTAAFISSMLGIQFAMCSIRRKWTTWGSSLTAFSLLMIALTSLSFCAMLNELAPNFITVDGGHVKVPGALVVVLYSIYVMLLLMLLYYSTCYLLNKISLYNVQRSPRRLDLELGGERQMSMVRAPRNESGRVQHNMRTNELSSEQSNSSTDLASENESSRVQSHTSTAVAPENDSGGTAVPGPSNESSRVQHHMNTATASENDSARIHFNSSMVPAPSNEWSGVLCHMSMAPAPRN